MATFLHSKGKDLQETWTLTNENYDKDILLATLMQKYGDFECLEQDPTLFKYYAEIWWKKHYRTFQKWYDAFDIPYSPLENYNRKEERLSKESASGDIYERFKHNDQDTRTHIGDSTGSSNMTGEHAESTEGMETASGKTTGTKSHTEDTQSDTAKTGQGKEAGTTTDTGHKTAGSKETWSEQKTTDTAQDIDTSSRSTSSNVNQSGRAIPVYDAQGHIIGYTIAEGTERSVEHGVSAFDEGADTIAEYNEGNYAPAHLDITHGAMSDNGSVNVSGNTRTNNAPGANRVTENSSGEKTITAATEDTTTFGTTAKDNTFNELGTEKQSATGTEIAHGSDDRETISTSDASGQTSQRTESQSQDKYTDTGSAQRTGDSQQKTATKREGQEDVYIHGNIGVTTSQQMLEAEIKVQLFSIYDTIAELFVDENCICIYKNNEGGCCLW